MSESSSAGSFSSRQLLETDFLMASRSPRGEKDVLGHHLTCWASVIACPGWLLLTFISAILQQHQQLSPVVLNQEFLTGSNCTWHMKSFCETSLSFGDRGNGRTSCSQWDSRRLGHCPYWALNCSLWKQPPYTSYHHSYLPRAVCWENRSTGALCSPNVWWKGELTTKAGRTPFGIEVALLQCRHWGSELR